MIAGRSMSSVDAGRLAVTTPLPRLPAARSTSATCATCGQSCTTVDPTHGSGPCDSDGKILGESYTSHIRTAFTVQFPTDAYEVQRSEDIGVRCTPGDKMVQFYCVVHLL